MNIDYELLIEQRNSLLFFLENADGILNLLDSLIDEGRPDESSVQ